MTTRPKPECALCGFGFTTRTKVVWYFGKPYCDDECARLADSLEDAS
jgi:hypothetical protein